jgi:hypothetical protein
VFHHATFKTTNKILIWKISFPSKIYAASNATKIKDKITVPIILIHIVAYTTSIISLPKIKYTIIYYHFKKNHSNFSKKSANRKKNIFKMTLIIPSNLQNMNNNSKIQ